MYRRTKNIDGELKDNEVLRIADNAFIPFNHANTDYQQYLAWLAEGNEPKQADEVE